jgi:hypothetical protein
MIRTTLDIQMTKAIIDIAAPLGISVHDHIIVGKNGHASLKGLKLIQDDDGIAARNQACEYIGFPGVSSRALRMVPLPDSVMKSVRPSGPP